MNLKLSSLPLLFACIPAFAYCTGSQEVVQPKPVRALKEEPKLAKKGPSGRSSRDDHERYKHLRAAKILQRVKFDGGSAYTHKNGKTVHYSPRHSIEFNNESNHIWMTFNGDYRQGRITSLGKSNPDSTEGEYGILTWKPQNYVGFKTGPSRKYFKSYLFKWKVKHVKTPEFTGRILHLRVFGSRGYVTAGSGMKELYRYVMKEKRRRY